MVCLRDGVLKIFSQRMSYSVCRTSPATPGLSNTFYAQVLTSEKCPASMDWTDNLAASRGLHSKTSIQPYSVQRIAMARDPANLPFWFDGKFSIYLDVFAVSAVRRLLARCKTGSATVRLEKRFYRGEGGQVREGEQQHVLKCKSLDELKRSKCKDVQGVNFKDNTF